MHTPDLSCPSGASRDAFARYDQLMRRHAWKTATALALLLLTPALGLMLQEGVPALGLDGNRLAVGMGAAGLAAAVALYAWSARELNGFVRRYPYLDDYYSAAQRQFDARTLGIGIGAGVALVLAGAGVGGLYAVPFNQMLGTGIFLAFVAAALWSFSYSVCLTGRSAFRHEEDASFTNPYPRVNLAAERRRQEFVGTACFAIMALATLAALLLLATQGEHAPYFWLTWALGATLCGVVALATGSLSQPSKVIR